MFDEGMALGWIPSVGIPHGTEPLGAASRSGHQPSGRANFGRRTPPSTQQLTHRREVIEALLIFRRGEARLALDSGGCLPPAWHGGDQDPRREAGSRQEVLGDRGRAQTQGDERAREKLKVLCEDYDKVVYFGSDGVLAILAHLIESEGLENLELRPLPSGESDQEEYGEADLTDYTPSSRCRQLLKVINEEGIAARAQLHRVLGWTPSEFEKVLDQLKRHNCIRWGREMKGDKGWVWCNYRGADRSDTDLVPQDQKPQPG